MRLVWTERAIADLQAIEDYVARGNPGAAVTLVDRLIARAETLVEHPRRGRTVPELAVPEVRELVTGNYRVVYRIAGSHIEVLHVFEGHRLFEGL